MNKKAELNKLQLAIEKDKTLPLREANLVFGEGNPDSEILFIGEAPGANEDRERRPFIGRAGQLLRKNIRDLGWKESGVYITNIVKRRPPENRDPTPEEIESFKPYLARQIEIIAPKIIVPLGRFSMNYFLPEAKIMRDQGKLFKIEDHFILPMLHPAAALRSSTTMKIFEETFKKLPAVLKNMKLENQKKNILILHDIRSVENVGAMFRTADAAGIDKIYLTGYTPTPLDRFGRKRGDLAKSALGAEEYVEWEFKESLPAFIRNLRREGFQIIAIEQDERSIDYKKVKLKSKNAFIVGTEVTGIPKNILKKCDVIAEIPMRGKKESLNVSVACGIALFRILNI